MTEGWPVLLVAAGVLWSLAAALVFPLPRGRLRMTLIAGVAALGSSACAAAGVLALRTPGATVLTVGRLEPLGALQVGVDGLTGFFLLLTGVVSGLLFAGRPGTLANLRGRVPIVALAVLLLSLVLLLIARDVFLFLVGWEGLAISFYLVVSAGHHRDDRAASAAYWTMGMAKVGGASILAAFVVLVVRAHAIGFQQIGEAAAQLPLPVAGVVLLLAVAGFGIKVAIVPLQSWLPRAYPAGPTGTPAFLAAVGLNAGFYGLIRVVLGFLPAGPEWWGSVVVLLGAITAVLGILWATVQSDLKVLMAYSSVENAGIIVAAIGTAMIGRAAGVPLLVSLGLVAALLQITVHSAAKAGLFLCADGVERHAETVDMERLGGLAPQLPGLATVFLVCAASLVGLPPLGGFVSEWMVLETLMQGFRVGSLVPEVAVALAGTLLALTAAIAGIAFVKAFFATFLGFARSHRAAVRVGRSTLVSGAGLALAGLAIGMAAPWFVYVFDPALAAVGAQAVGPRVSTGELLIAPVFADFSSISPTEVAIVLPAFALLLVLLLVLTRNRRIPIRRTPVWASGSVPGEARTQYTPTGWSNPTRVVFDAALRTKRTVRRRGPDLAPVGVRYSSRVPAAVDEWLVLPGARALLRLVGWLQGLQSGSLARYLSYVLAVLVIVLVTVAVLAR
jgi:hydrogenase-4 component B